VVAVEGQSRGKSLQDDLRAVPAAALIGLARGAITPGGGMLAAAAATERVCTHHVVARAVGTKVQIQLWEELIDSYPRTLRFKTPVGEPVPLVARAYDRYEMEHHCMCENRPTITVHTHDRLVRYHWQAREPSVRHNGAGGVAGPSTSREDTWGGFVWAGSKARRRQDRSQTRDLSTVLFDPPLLDLGQTVEQEVRLTVAVRESVLGALTIYPRIAPPRLAAEYSLKFTISRVSSEGLTGEAAQGVSDLPVSEPDCYVPDVYEWELAVRHEAGPRQWPRSKYRDVGRAIPRSKQGCRERHAWRPGDALYVHPEDGEAVFDDPEGDEVSGFSPPNNHRRPIADASIPPRTAVRRPSRQPTCAAARRRRGPANCA
jgi:hypothetical protein